MSIYIPKFKESFLNFPLKPIKLQGEFKAVLRDLNGNVLYESDWIKNGLTRTGMNYPGQVHNGCALGDDGGPHDFELIELRNRLDYNPSNPSANMGNTSGPNPGYAEGHTGPPDYRAWRQEYWRFAAGLATGTIRELGVYTSPDRWNPDGSKGAPSGTFEPRLAARAIINPGITKTADQVLDIHHRVYASRAGIGDPDITGTIDINGTTFDWTQRLYNYDFGTPGHVLGVHSGSVFSLLNAGGGFCVLNHSTGILPATNSRKDDNEPAGGLFNSPTTNVHVYSPYTFNSYQQEITSEWNLSQGNLTLNAIDGPPAPINHLFFWDSVLGYQGNFYSDGSGWQVFLEPQGGAPNNFIKDADHILNISFTKSWTNVP